MKSHEKRKDIFTVMTAQKRPRRNPRHIQPRIVRMAEAIERPEDSASSVPLSA